RLVLFLVGLWQRVDGLRTPRRHVGGDLGRLGPVGSVLSPDVDRRELARTTVPRAETEIVHLEDDVDIELLCSLRAGGATAGLDCLPGNDGVARTSDLSFERRKQRAALHDDVVFALNGTARAHTLRRTEVGR